MNVSWEWLLDPIAPARFFETYYEREPLWIERCDPTRFQHLLSLDAVDHFLAVTSPSHPEVFLVDAARLLTSADYTLADSD